MSRFNMSQLSTFANSVDKDIQSYFWGSELSQAKSSYRWNPESVISTSTKNGMNGGDNAAEDSNDSVSVDNDRDFIEHSLVLTNVCLGPKVEGMHVVVVKTTSILNNAVNEHRIIVMDPAREHMKQLQLEFNYNSNTKVEFILKEGSGPVSLSGTHHMVMNQMTEENVESDNEDDVGEEEEDIEEEEVKELAEDSEKMDDDEPEEDVVSDVDDSTPESSPEKKGKNGKAKPKANLKVKATTNGRTVSKDPPAKETKKAAAAPPAKGRKRARDTDESDGVPVPAQKKPAKKTKAK